MRIIADENIPFLSEFFSVFGDVVPVNGRNLSGAQLAAADILLVRSVTPVNEVLLANSPVGFVGTCTIGTDHLDTEYLSSAGIAYASAPGCNAGGVVQYVLTALTQLRADWRGLKVGVVGCGNVGGRLCRTLRQLGINAVAYDPLLTVSDDAPLVEFDEVLQADVICLHAPLTRAGDFPTEHMFNQEVLERLRPGTLLLNAGRGGVVDNRALLTHVQQGAALQVVLDVWENEPAIDAELARRIAIATPHIAGYSNEGRTNGSVMICRALAEFLGWNTVAIEQHLATVALKVEGRHGEIAAYSLEQALAQAYDLNGDHQRLMAAVNGAEPLGFAFDKLRKHYPERHEPNHFQVRLEQPDTELQAQLDAAGFQVVM